MCAFDRREPGFELTREYQGLRISPVGKIWIECEDFAPFCKLTSNSRRNR